jgi:Fe(3+) dicitrate transport protein
MKRVGAAISAVMSIALFAGAARAQDATSPAQPPPAQPPPPPPEAPEVRVIGDKADSLQKVPGSGTVISQQEIERTQPYDAGEILRRVPGVQVRQEEGGGFRLDLGVRGLDPGRARRVLILEDGIPISLNPYAEPDLYYLPQIERMRGVEVVKGSGSILFGPQTIGGVVNFVTLAPTSTPHAMVDQEVGDRRYTRTTARYGDGLGEHIRYVVQGTYKRGDGFRNENFDSTDVFGKMQFDTSTKGEATVKLGFHQDVADSDDVGLTRAMFKGTPERPTLAPDDKMYQRHLEASFIHEQRFTENTKLRTLAYMYETTRIWRRQDFDRFFTAGASYDHIVGDQSIPNGAIFFRNTDTILDRAYDVAGLEPRLEHRFETGDVSHTLDFGGRALVETAHYQQRAGGTPTALSGANANEEQHRTFALAAYAQDRVAFRDDLLVTPGLRFEHASYERITTRIGNVDAYNVGDSSVSAVIPGIGIIYGSRAAHIFAGLHEGFSPPRLADSISPKGVPAQLDPEYSTNLEIGGRLNQKKIFRGELTFFGSKFTNQVITGSSPTGPSLINGGETVHIGTEIAGTLGIGAIAKIPTVIDLTSRYTYARATFVGGQYAGNILPYAPLYSVTTSLDVEQPTGTTGGVVGMVAWTHTGQQFTDEANTRFEDTTGQYGIIPEFNVVDANVGYHHKPTGLTLRLMAKGLLNQIYIAERRPQGIHAAGFREIILGLRWDWEAAPSQ